MSTRALRISLSKSSAISDFAVLGIFHSCFHLEMLPPNLSLLKNFLATFMLVR